MTPVRWAVVVPVKELGAAKTRLDPDPDVRAALALAMARDVVAAARACPVVAGVLVVTNDVRAAGALAGDGATVVADVADAGLNPALADGARFARMLWPRAGVAALSSDLACADPDVLAAVLAAAAEHERAVVADARGDGTTVLTAGPGSELAPRYGAGSLGAHVATGAKLVAADSRLRRDVDTPADLAAAVALGVGSFTREALRTARVGG